MPQDESQCEGHSTGQASRVEAPLHLIALFGGLQRNVSMPIKWDSTKQGRRREESGR
jgi:hypothetical protein